MGVSRGVTFYRSSQESYIFKDGDRFPEGSIIFAEDTYSLFLKNRGEFIRFMGALYDGSMYNIDLSKDSLFKVLYYKRRNFGR